VLIAEFTFNGEGAHHSEVSSPPPRSFEYSEKTFHPLDPITLAQLSEVEQMAKKLLVSERIINKTGRYNLASSNSFDLNQVLQARDAAGYLRTIISFDTFAGGYDLNALATDMERKHTPEEDPSQFGRVVLCLRNVIFGAETLRPGFRLKCDISEWL
jgi:hypothetical protein